MVITRAIIGGVIGFLAASVLYSQYLPRWVPEMFSENPVLFYGVFILVCTLLGLNWGYTEIPDSKEKDPEKRSFPVNRILTGLFSGFLAASVLYTKYMPSWVPVFLSEYPVIFFAIFTSLGGLISYIWCTTDA